MNSDLNQAKNLYNKGQIDEAIKLLTDETFSKSLDTESESEKFNFELSGCKKIL